MENSNKIVNLIVHRDCELSFCIVHHFRDGKNDVYSLNDEDKGKIWEKAQNPYYFRIPRLFREGCKLRLVSERKDYRKTTDLEFLGFEKKKKVRAQFKLLDQSDRFSSLTAIDKQMILLKQQLIDLEQKKKKKLNHLEELRNVGDAVSSKNG